MRPEALHGGAAKRDRAAEEMPRPIICTRGRLHPALGRIFLRKTLLRPCAVALHLLAPYSLVYGVIELFRSDIVTNWQSLFGLPNFVELCLRQTVGRQ
jgi:hypothetical protein